MAFGEQKEVEKIEKKHITSRRLGTIQPFKVIIPKSFIMQKSSKWGVPSQTLAALGLCRTDITTAKTDVFFLLSKDRSNQWLKSKFAYEQLPKFLYKNYKTFCTRCNPNLLQHTSKEENSSHYVSANRLNRFDEPHNYIWLQNYKITKMVGQQ